MDSLNATILPHPALAFVPIEGGEFMMGDDHGEFDREKPAHTVRVSSFYLCKYPVTQGLYKWVTKTNPSDFKGDNRPVENVSWEDARQFVRQLNDLDEVQQFFKTIDPSAMAFRLPSEAEWEYAARGGQYSQGYTYAGSDRLKQVGWYDDNSGNETKDVGSLLANELGLYDMSGNVWEWCEDDWHDNYEGAPTDSSPWVDAPEKGVYRVIRGGSYFFIAVNCRPAARRRITPDDRGDDIGFRLVLSLQSVG